MEEAAPCLGPWCVEAMLCLEDRCDDPITLAEDANVELPCGEDFKDEEDEEGRGVED